MTDKDGFPAMGLAEGERVIWSGRSRPAGVLAAVAPNMLVAAFAGCLALGFAPATNSMGLLLSPVVDSALRTVTPPPLPRMFLERTPRGIPPAPAPIPISMTTGPAATPPPLRQAGISDVDVGVGAFLIVCQTILLYLAAATAFVGARTLVGQLASRHAVTDARIVSRHPRGSESVPIRALRGIRVRRHPFGTSLAIQVAGRRRPLLFLGLAPDAARDAERALGTACREA